MSQRLILMRHAKSSWKSDAKSDHARPLNKRGRRDAPRIAQALADRGWWPKTAIISDSARTLETFQRMVEGHAPVELHPERALYLASIAEIRDCLQARDPGEGPVLMLGHNPGWEEALTWMTGSQEPMTTANAALLQAEAASWTEALAGPHGFELVALLRPKTLESEAEGPTA